MASGDIPSVNDIINLEHLAKPPRKHAGTILQTGSVSAGEPGQRSDRFNAATLHDGMAAPSFALQTHLLGQILRA